MSRGDTTSIKLRAQEIISNSPTAIGTQEAIEMVLQERYGDDVVALRKITSLLAASTLSGIRKRTYELPEEDGQGALFDVPGVIGIATDEGDLLIPRNQATLGNVRQWQKEGQQHHATQLYRFRRAGKDLDAIEDHPDEVAWEEEARSVLTERKRKESTEIES